MSAPGPGALLSRMGPCPAGSSSWPRHRRRARGSRPERPASRLSLVAPRDARWPTGPSSFSAGGDLADAQRLVQDGDRSPGRHLGAGCGDTDQWPACPGTHATVRGSPAAVSNTGSGPPAALNPGNRARAECRAGAHSGARAAPSPGRTARRPTPWPTAPCPPASANGARPSTTSPSPRSARRSPPISKAFGTNPIMSGGGTRKPSFHNHRCSNGADVPRGSPLPSSIARARCRRWPN